MSDLIDRIEQRITFQDNGCWTIGNSRPKARLDDGSRAWAYRALWEALVGPIPPGMVIDHLCEDPRCVNLDHLEVVTKRENTIRGPRGLTDWCRSGKHPWVPENIYVNPSSGRNHCRSCIRERRRSRG